ncbi:hypothetical protein KM540_gp141 [Western grey kangaroopox virus]|uniref:Uncharacterized protein n=1 Tax=Western grey kangaroopox virus TaxID=1566307 RepID=A0A2C9DST9_9POXV|nr:hypothetical protein KM540_gp141 [Western grey kangaroopox virus]ATI21072.1 hypothetical protein [Western grey kangaroopox virus]
MEIIRKIHAERVVTDKDVQAFLAALGLREPEPNVLSSSGPLLRWSELYPLERQDYTARDVVALFRVLVGSVPSLVTRDLLFHAFDDRLGVRLDTSRLDLLFGHGVASLPFPAFSRRLLYLLA